MNKTSIINHDDTADDMLNAFDLEKFLLSVKSSLLWIALIFVFAGSVAFLIVRYTKPLYESQSVLKLDMESEASSLGLASENFGQTGMNNISGEIELLKSKLFFNKVISVANLEVSYHFYGRYLTDERYRNSPFVVSYKLHNAQYYDRPFDLEILDETSYRLSYHKGSQQVNEEHAFGEEIRNADFNLLIEKTRFFQFPQVSGTYFFTINSNDALIAYLQKNVKVTPENFNARTIRISLSDHNQYKARDLVMAIDTLYLDHTKQAKNQTIDQKIEFLNSQIRETEAKIEGFEEYFEDFIVDNRTTNYQSEIAKTIVVLNALDTTEERLKNEILDIDLLLQEEVNGQLLNVSPLLIDKLPKVVGNYLTAYQELLEERQQKIGNYNENTYVIRRLNARIEEEYKKFSDILGDYKKELLTRLNAINHRRSMLERTFSNMPSMSTEFTKTHRFYALQEEFLLNLTKSKMELEITKAGTVTNFVVLSPASLPMVPIEPKPIILYGGAIALSFVISLFLILVRYLLNNRISTIKELESLIHVPILGTLPKYRKQKLTTTKLVVGSSSKSAFSEALRTIRTNMEFLNGSGKTQMLTITSTISGEGKTFIAVNLGAIFAYTKQKVCIVDLDMRKPKVHLAFGDEPHYKGVSTLLIRKDRLDDCIMDTSVEDLYYIPAGPTPPNPSELILNQEYKELLEELKSRFDLVILDTPPVGLVTDAVMSMKESDLQLYVVRSEYSKRGFTQSIDNLKKINQFSNLTVIFNSVTTAGKSYGYGYGSGYGYYDDSH